LRVRIASGGNAADLLAFTGFTLGEGNAVMQGTTQIGTRTSDGVGSNELHITLNANATVAVVQQLLRSITFSTTSTPGSRTIAFSVSDGDGETSLELTKTVVVS
jgi:hypothetical protein